MFRVLWTAGVLTVACMPLRATSCVRLSPCAVFRPGGVVFVGSVVSVQPLPEPVLNSLDYRTTRARVEVREVFAGLTEGTKEVTIEAGDWLKAGSELVFDAYGLEGGGYGLRVCGQTAEASDRNEFLRYLRSRKKGLEATSVAVAVFSSHRGLPGVDVTIRGPEGARQGSTDREGIAQFAGIPAGKYSISVAKAHFRLSEGPYNDTEIEVLDQACPTARIALVSSATVSGVLRGADGRTLAGAEVELVSVEHDVVGFDATTDEKGSFRFEDVLPGRYLLGTNIRFEGMATGNIQRAYFPGREHRSEAAEIEVGAGAALTGLQLTLPDAGPRRKIRVCVVDSAGKPVPEARIFDASWQGDRVVQYGRIDRLTADESGCAVTEGYERASYPVIASTESSSKFLTSDPATIPPGKGPAYVVLVLEPAKKE